MAAEAARYDQRGGLLMPPLTLADVCLIIIAVCSVVLTVHFV